MPKRNNMYGVAYKPVHKSRNQHKHGNDPATKSPTHSGLVNFLAVSGVCKPKLAVIAQIFVCLSILMVAANAWAASVDLTVVDTEGNDTIFNGDPDGEQLRITISVTGNDDDPAAPYDYEVTVDGYEEAVAKIGNLQLGATSDKNETVIISSGWHGGDLSDGTYTMRVEIRDANDALLATDTASFTFDTTDPEISIGVDETAFSPNRDRVLDTIDVFYSISEDVEESTLEFLRKTGESEVSFGQPVNLSERDGSHVYGWDGGGRGRNIFPDGQYVLAFSVTDQAGNSSETQKTGEITIDTVAPIISSIAANENLPIISGGFINVPIQSIKVTADKGEGTELDLGSDHNEVTIKNQRNVTINGDLSHNESILTFVFGNRLDAASENGKYTASIAVADRAGNAAERTLDFTFDNIAPTLRTVATSEGELTPGSGVSTWMNFVEATLRDNLEDGLSLSDSTIRLTGPNGAVLGRQTQPDDDRIRWFLLSPLLARDGLMDGEYTIEVVAIDKAGNQTGTLEEPLEILFIYDNLAPLVTLGLDEESPFTLNQDTIYHAQPLSQIVATFDDAGVGVNFRGNTDIVFDTLPGRKLVAQERNQLTYVLETPLASRDGSQDGRYDLNVQATDTLGNTETYNYEFVYDTQIPALASTVPAANTTVSELSEVRVVLDEATSGIDFIQSDFRLTRNVDGNEIDVPVNVTSNGADAATLTLARPIALDGSDDGTYTIEISPTDLAGNVGVIVRREFYLVSQSRPEIRLVMPETTTVNDLTTVVAELSGYIGAGIDFDASTLTVRDAQSRLVAQTELERDEVNNLLTWNIEAPLPRDGSVDGEYTVTATFVDFTGRRFTRQFQLLLDTQFPAIESVQVATDSQPELSTDSTTTVAEGFSQIVVTFENAQEGFVSGIDFINTNVTLTNSTGESISVNRSDDGQSVLTLDFQALTQLGEYVIAITPQDLAGNQSAAPFVYRLRVDVPLPTVSLVLISGKLGTIVYVNGDSTNIVATFADLSGAGLDLNDGGSTITVTNESGLPAPGITTSNGTDQLTWSPIVLPTDGSADGRYTVTVTPKDKAGRQGDVVYRQFVYDTQEPRITASDPVSLSQPATYIGGTLTQLQFTVEDVGPAGLELEEQTVELLGLQGTPIAAALTLDEINSYLYLTLDTPLAQDGSADGEYTVKVSLVDKAGNILDSEQTFVYDSQVPRLASVSVNTESAMELVPQEITEISESISSITLQFEEATRVDFTNTVVDLVGPDGQPISLNISADGLTQLTARFVELTQAGLYTLSVTPQDIAGNVAQGAVQYSFRLVFVLPSVSSVELGGQTGDVVFLNGSDSTIVATLVDGTGTGLDLGEGGSSIVVTNPSGTAVPGQTRSDGANQLIWEPISLPTDGSADGRYTVAVTPVDKAGRQGDVVYRQFIYDTQEPRVTASNPVSLNQPATYIGGTLTQLQFTVEDVGPAGLELEEQTVELLGLQGTPIAAALTLDEINSYLYLTLDTPLAQDGSADGEYTVKVSLVDKAGNILDSEQTFVYDSQVPRLASVSVNTESAMELVPQEITEISESISSITLQFEEATRVDFTNTVVDLVGPDGQPISLNISADGLTQLTARFVELTQAGLYTLSVTPQDIAGNVAQGAVQYSFRLVFVLPSVSSVELGGQTGDVVFLNGSDSTIVATLVDGTGTGLDLGEGGSSIVVTSPTGAVVSGQTRSDGANQLIWEPISLPTDGSADGRYTVAVTPVDKAGRQGDVVYRQFIYDTENPRITASSPIVLSQPVSYISGLNQFTFTVEDVGPADLLLESQTIELIDSSGSAVPATLTYDELTNQLYLTLSSPFARDGSVDGAYTVKLSLIDRAGNTLDLEHLLIYDSQVPQLSSVIVDTEAPLELLPEQVGEVSESISSITLQFEEATKVDFANTAITLVGPNEASIPLTLEDDGISQLTASFLNLRQVGIYTLSVTPQDVAGNVATGAINYRFVLSLGLPSVSSLVIGGKSEDVVFINGSDTTIIATLMDATGIGLVLGEGGSSIVVTNPSGAVVPGQTRTDGVNQLIWQPISLPTDGSADGRYTVAITPIDKTGRQGDVVYRQFIYDTESPRITVSSPLMLSQPMSYVDGGLNQFTFTVEDVGPADLLLEAQTIELIDSSGSAVPATQTYDELTNQLYLTLSPPFARDGSADGEYTVKIFLLDRAGNALDSEHTFIYDSQAPELSSVLLNTESPVLLDPQLIAYISETVSSITLRFEEATRVDFANTVVALTGPGEQGIPINISVSESLMQLTARFVELTQDGSYTLSVTPQDIAGNVVQGAMRYSFLLDTESPRITASSPLMLSQPVSYISGLNQFTFTVEDVGPADLLLESQTIELIDSSGSAVPATLTYDELTNQLYLTLSSPFARDGSVDGAYTVKLSLIDRAGNTLDLEHSLIYDSQVPRLSSVIVDTESPLELLPEQVAEVSESISNITLQFDETTKVDFANTVIALVGPNEASIPLTLEDDGISRLTASFLGLRQVGIYTLSVTPQDVAGNVATGAINYQFVLSLGLPSVSSLVIGGKSEDVVFINGSDTTIIATLMDATGIGLVLGEGGSSIVVTSPTGAVVSGQTRSDGANQLIWEPISLPTDGSADGRYTVAVTPVDKAGRQGDVVYRQFIYDTENPRITASSPIVLSQPVSYISGLNQFTFTVEDVGPADLLLESQTIELIDSSGSAVPATLTYDELTNQLYLTLSSPFARDGSVDGAYTVKLSLIDRAGNTLDLEHLLIYDSQVPQLSSVIVDTEAPLELLPEQVGEVSESISSITLQFEEATKVDFANTAITLVGPNEASIPLTLEDDGISQLTASFLNLRQVGIYTLSVTPQDVAGNVATGAINYQFVLSLGLPSVSSLVIGGKSEDVVFINGSDTTIIATLMDATGIGLVLGEGGSSIVVTSPTGAVVSGQTRSDGANQLIWEPISLPTDGSADGRYTVAVTPVDKAGRQGDVVYRQFIYDTENPRITASSPIVLSQPVSYISGLNQFTFTVEDVGPADLLLESQTIELIDSSGSAVPATLTYDELTNQLYLTLSSPFARDGSVDGAYTVRISLVDKAGNRLDSEHTLIYDSQVPRLSSVMVNAEVPVELVQQEVTEILEPISSITLQFDEATRVDFENTVITLVNSDATDASGELAAVEIPLTLEDDGISQMTVSFLELNQIGTYVLSIRPQDIAGNVATGAFNYTFILDIPLPSVSSIIIGDAETVAGGDIAYVNASNMIIGAELLDPTETGLSFGSDGSDITVVDASNTIVAGAIGSNGVNLLLWQPITLTTDGTTDGRYSVYVFPVDKAGRQGSTAYREFIYDTQEPEIIGANPIDLSQPVSYISQSLTQFHFTVADVGPAELELSDQKVSLRDASGNLVTAQLTNDTNSQLFLTLDQPLPLDGSMDGEYTVAVELTDKAGNAFTVEHRIVYDTQAPTLVSTVPADGSLLTEDVTQIQVTLNDEGGSGIDWTTTMVTLVNPSGQQISGELVSNGTTTLTLSTNQLVEDGRYIIRVRAVDRAGNGNATLFERNFLLSRRLPTIVSTEPVTAPEDEAFTNEEIEQIEVELETDDENHLSTLRLLNPDNQVVAGQQQRASGRLIYNLVRPLATDGSADGIYTIEFTPISASGRSGEIQRLTFTYDTQAPEIESDDVINFVVAQPGVNNSLTEISVNLTDDTSGIDWENLDEEWLTFERRSPNPAKISGRVSDDGQSTLTFRLTVPLADNGSADGEYRITVTPKDRAGNDDEPYEKVFIYDTSPPMVDAGTLLINDAPLLVDINADNYPTAVSSRGGVVIQANIFDTGLGVNLAQSKIIVRRPDGSEVSGNTQQNGVDTIVFKSDGLSFQGSYQVTVMSVGNDSELLGFAPTDSITTEFLYETGEPTATVTSDGGETELTDEPLPLEGTTSDPAGTQRIGEGEIPVPASGVWLVEIVGTGPDKQPIDPVPAVDDSNAQEEPWNRWSIDFLPTRSGEYDLDVRVTDNAGNYAVYDVGTYTMSVSLTFRGSTFGWPNPLRLSQRDVAFFSFDVNVPLGETIELTLSIYDWSGDMVLSQTYPDVVSGQRNDQLVKWNLENQAGTPVARGLYIFRLEAVNAAGNRANTVGKVLVVD